MGDVAAAKPETPDVDDLFQKQDVDDLFPLGYKPPPPTSQPVRNVSPIQDRLFADPGRAHARILDAFGYGFQQGWGSATPEFSEADEGLRKAGIYNDYAKGQHNIIKAANEAIMRPAIAAIVAGKGLMGGAFRGAQEAVAQAGVEAHIPEISIGGYRLLGSSAELGHELAGAAEAFPAGIHQPMGIPHVPEVISTAKSLDTIGAGEGGYFGTKPVESAPPVEAAAAATKAEEAAVKPAGESTPSPVPQPATALAKQPASDIHAVARQIAPQTFEEFDALAQKKDTFRRWIDELREVRDQSARETAPHADEIATLNEQIEAQQAKKGGHGKLQSLIGKRDALTEERDAYIAEHTASDSADMAKVRQQLMEADYRMRDLAGDVSRAYREAQSRMPEVEAVEPPTAVATETPQAAAPTVQQPAAVAAPAVAPAEATNPEALVKAANKTSEAAGKQAVKPAPAAATEQPEEAVPPARLPIAHAPSIVADVSQKLVAAGRPAEEAEAAAQIVAAYWETRAQRFGGARGTAAEMYAREAPEIVAGKEKKAVRQPEMAQTKTRQGRIRVRDDGRNTITLMKSADASTFIHETGHDWLERMLDDARDADAPAALKEDANTVLKWLGVDSPDGIKTRHHEKFARGFETYVMEGRAPSWALARVFAQFKSWLTTIYKTVAALKAPISDDIRGVFDRMLAEKPERTVIAPERPSAGGLAEKHEALVDATPPEQGFNVAGGIRKERDSHAATNQLNENDARLENAREGTGEHAPGGTQSPGTANASGTVGREAEAAGRAGAIGEGGSEASAEGAGPRKGAGSERLNKAPTPLLQFIASQGGIKASDALISDLRQSLGGKNHYVPGFGQLIRTPRQLSSAASKAGRLEAMSIDRATTAAVERGLLPEGSTPRDLMDALDNEVRGLSGGKEADAGAEAHAEHSFLEGLNDALREHGGAELSDKERARALELWHKEGIHDPSAIIERLALEADDEEIGSGAPERAPGVVGWDEPAPGWELSHDGGPAPGAGEHLEAAQSGEPGGGAARAGGQAEGTSLEATTDLPRSETQLVDKAGNIRLDNLGTPEDVNAVIRATAVENDDFLGARRDVIPDSEVLKLAEALGMDAAQLSQRKLGQAFNAEQIVAARKLLIQSAQNVRDLAAKIAGGTDADVAAYAEARARHMMIQEQVSGITAEAGRALRAFRSLAGSKEAADISAFLKNTQGKTLYQMREEGALLAMMETPQQVSKAVAEANLTRWQRIRGGILSWFINNLISGPITHAGYSIGNTVVQLFKATVDTSVAATIGALRNAPAGERVYFGEVGAQLYGMVRGMRDGFGPAMTALKTGVPYMKGDVNAIASISEAHARQQAIPGMIGYVMETPSRAVTAIHTVHYAMNYEAEIARRAYRAAIGKGLEVGTDEFNTSVAKFTQSPPEAEMTAAHDEAMKMVLMKSAPFGTAQYHLQKAVNGNILAKIVMPFMQVGSNILHESFIERTPLGAMSQTVRDNMMGKNGAVARDAQAARIAVGIGVSTAVLGLTAEGILTGGGPSDPKELAVKEMTGWRPYSIRIGDFYVPYRKYLGGLGPLIAGTSDVYEVGHALTEEGLTKAAAASLFGFAEVIADESWARGLANFIDAARHWDRDGGRYLRNLAADFIPFSIGMQQITNLADPYRREVRGLLDSARAHVPGLSQSLHPVRDIWGEPILSHTALGPSRTVNDPAAQALLDAGYYPAKMLRKIRGVDLTDQQYDDLTRIAGRMARMRVSAFTNTPGFAMLPKQTRAAKLQEIISDAREAAQSMILMQNPDIIQKANDAKLAKLKGETVH